MESATYAAQITLSNNAALERILRLAKAALDAETVAIYETEAEGGWSVLSATENHPEEESELIRQAIGEETEFIVPSLESHPELANHRWAMAPFEVRFLAAVAVTVGDEKKPLGHLVITDTRERCLDAAEGEVLSDLGQMCAEIFQLEATRATARDAEEQLEHEREEKQLLISALENSNRKLAQFAYVASHDLQEPLRMVTGFLGLLQDEYSDRLDEEANEYIAFAVDGAARMKQMIGDLLTYSRMSSSTEPYVEVDMELELGRAEREIVSNYPDATVEITHSKLPLVSGRKEQIFRLFSNLLVNAIQHSGPSPRIEVGYESLEEHHLFTVRDHGKGIAQDQHSRIFEIFVSGSRDSSRPGSGMGLAICTTIVEEHGGRLWVESMPGEGATFYFTISRGDPHE